MSVLFDTMRIRGPENIGSSTPHELLPVPADGRRISKETTAVVLGGEITCDGCFAAWCCRVLQENHRSYSSSSKQLQQMRNNQDRLPFSTLLAAI